METVNTDNVIKFKKPQSEEVLYEAEYDWRKAVVADLKSLDRRLFNLAFVPFMLSVMNLLLFFYLIFEIGKGN